MRVPFRRSGSDDAPDEVIRAVEGSNGGKVLSAAPEADSRSWLVACTYQLALVDPGRGPGSELAWTHTWHEIDSASWGRESGQLTVTWVDRSRPGQWRLGDGAKERVFLQTVRERVQASVVLAEELELSGRRTGRAVIRQDLRTGALLEQVVLGRGVRPDEEVSAASAKALSWLREQVGLDQP